MAELCSTVVCKAELGRDELGYFARRFPSKVLTVWSSFFLLLVIKYQRREMNSGKNC